LPEKSGGFGYLMLGAQAAGAEVEPFRLTVNGEGDGVNIGGPLSVGAALGVTYVMTELRCFSAYVALQFQVSFRKEKGIAIIR
jgi:hypothetical protein